LNGSENISKKKKEELRNSFH